MAQAAYLEALQASALALPTHLALLAWAAAVAVELRAVIQQPLARLQCCRRCSKAAMARLQAMAAQLAMATSRTAPQLG